MSEAAEKHGIIIVHGVGQHKPLQVLTGFAAGFVETLRDMVGPGASVTVTPPPNVSLKASLDGAKPPQYVEVSLYQNQQCTKVYRIEEAYWQHVVHRPSLLDIARWLWNLVLRLTGLKDSRVAWLGMGVVGFAMFLGELYLVLLALDVARRWLADLLQRVVQFVSLQPPPAWVTQLSDRTLFSAPLSVPAWGLIVVTVVLLSAAGIQFAAAVREMTLERRVPWGWRRKAPWYVGSAFLSLGTWVGIAVFLHQLLISVQIGFPGRKLILDCLGGLVKWLRQDALADGMVYASSRPKPRETQKAMQDAVKSKVTGFPKAFESIHIVAHSLGSIVSFEVLSSLVSGVALQPKHKKRIRTFFTAGCPLIKFLDVLADDPLTGRVRNFALARVITVSRFLAYGDAGPERSTGTRILERVIQSPRVTQLAGTRMLEPRFRRGEWTEVLPDLEDLQKRRGRQPYPKRFDGVLPSRGLPKDFKWCNFVADRDLAPDRLEKKPHFPPPDSITAEEKQELEDYPGEVEDVHVKSTRGLGAHFAYWDKNSETLRYILEQIDPAVFGQRFHDLALIRKAQLRAAEEPSGMP